MPDAGLPALDTYTMLQQAGANRAQNMGLGGGGGSIDNATGAYTGDTSVDLGGSFTTGINAADSTDPRNLMSSAGGGSGLGSLSPMLIAMTKRMLASNSDDLTSEDKGLALAHAGFSMAGGTSPFALTNIGQGGAEGLQALQQMRQQRAVLAMKNLQLLNAGVNAQALNEQRGARTGLINQTLGNTQAARFTPDQTNQVVQYITDRGDLSGGLRMAGVGIVGTANRADIIKALNGAGRSDLAQQALQWAADNAESVQIGKVKAGPETINTGAGESLRTPPPIPRVGAQTAPPPAPAATTTTVPPPIGAPPPPPVTTPPPVVIKAPLAAPTEPLSMQSPPNDPRWAAIPVAPQPSNNLSKPAMAEAVKTADQYGELQQQIDTAARAAKQQNFVYDNLLDASKKIKLGAGAETLNDANRVLLSAGRGMNGLLESAGIKPMDLSDLTDTVSNTDDYRKNAVGLLGSLVKTVSPRAAFQEVKFFSGGTLGEGVSPQGHELLGASLMAPGDYANAEQRLANAYKYRPGNDSHTLAGFENFANQNIDPAVFMFNRLSPEVATSVLKEAMSRPGGPAMVSKLEKQIAFAKSMGLY